mmetsp:Transcript_52859/g.158219  ORF Transcript_52859/g.158219 Transcript_52859/m.158219 type:complete len:124 (-) Transcript_52859:80-451(-)
MKKTPASAFHRKDTNDEIISKLEICTRIPSKSSRSTLTVKDHFGCAVEHMDDSESVEKLSVSTPQGIQVAQLKGQPECHKESQKEARKKEKSSDSDDSAGRLGRDGHGEIPLTDLSSDEDIMI